MEHRPLLDVLAGKAFPELAAALRDAAPGALKRWEALVRESLPKADELTLTQLRDDMPEVVELMARALQAAEPLHTDKLVDASPKHGEVRFHQEFKLNELLIEYNILRAIVIDEVMRQLDREIKAEEMVALNAAVDIATRRSVVAFSGHQARQLQAATEAQSKYLSFLSHDLRGGLNGVFLMIEVLKRELASEPRLAETVEDLDMMRRSLLETVSTMDRFLHAERFRKGKVQVRPATVRVGNLLSEISSHFSYQAKDKGIALKVDSPADCNVVSDRELLQMILQNLASNAVKYTTKGSVQIRAKSTEGGGCLIAVIDEGPGIEAAKLSDLFGAFTRGDTHGQPGVGLGLSIARQAAELLGVKLWAESQPGKGSTFFVQIPKEVPKKNAEG